MFKLTLVFLIFLIFLSCAKEDNLQGRIENLGRKKDSTPPIIKLVGEDIILYVGDNYVDKGAEAYDEEDGDLTSEVKIESNNVNTEIDGKYEIIYIVKDRAGNVSKIKRAVIVKYCTLERMQDRPFANSKIEPIGNGIERPFLICNYEQFLNIDGYLTEAYNFRFKEDIDASLSKTISYESIGTITPFIGTLNGENHTIKNLHISNPSELKDNHGLFSSIKNAAIKNLKLENFNISVPEGSNIGALSGSATGNTQISNIDVSNSKIIGFKNVGGVIGNFSGIMEKVSSNNSVDGNTSVGGLIGILNLHGGVLKDSYSLSKVKGSNCVGGLVGSLKKGNIINTYSKSKVFGNPKSEKIAGLIGFIDASLYLVKNSFSVSNLEGHCVSFCDQFVGGLMYRTGKLENVYSISKSRSSDVRQIKNIELLYKNDHKVYNETKDPWDFVGHSSDGDKEIWIQGHNSLPVLNSNM